MRATLRILSPAWRAPTGAGRRPLERGRPVAGYAPPPLTWTAVHRWNRRSPPCGRPCGPCRPHGGLLRGRGVVRWNEDGPPPDTLPRRCPGPPCSGGTVGARPAGDPADPAARMARSYGARSPPAAERTDRRSRG